MSLAAKLPKRVSICRSLFPTKSVKDSASVGVVEKIKLILLDIKKLMGCADMGLHAGTVGKSD